MRYFINTLQPTLRGKLVASFLLASLFTVSCLSDDEGEVEPLAAAMESVEPSEIESNSIELNPIPSSIDEACDFEDDRDEQTYKCVKIGAQVWMAENLKFNASSSICYNYDASNCNTYGRLYNWNTAKTACPAGWRLPNEDDWNTLVTNAGGMKSAGKHLKAKNGWSSCDSYPCEDTYGFSALPGGIGRSNGTFDGVGTYCSWWSAKEHSSTDAFQRIINFNNDDAPFAPRVKSILFSVRCIQN